MTGTFFDDDFFGRSSGSDPNWQYPLLRDVISPDANGATLDAQGLLTGAIVEVEPGVFDIPLTGGLVQTNPDQGIVMAFPMRDNNGNEAQQALAGLSYVGEVLSGAGASTDVIAACGMADTSALGTSVWGGIDFGGTPRARAGTGGTWSPSNVLASAVQWVGGVVGMASTAANTDVTMAYSVASLALADGLRVKYAPHAVVTTFTGPPVFFISIFGDAAMSARTVRLSVKYLASVLPAPGRFE